jgi:hypothetical protein
LGSDSVWAQAIVFSQTVDLIALILADSSFSPKSMHILEPDLEQALVQETVEPLNATIAPGFAGWIEDRLNA